MKFLNSAEPAIEDGDTLTYRGDIHTPQHTYSYWRPSPVEVLRIMRGRPIRLGVYGKSHPPVSVDTEE